MAVFELENDDQRRAVGVRIIPCFCAPILVTVALTEDTDIADFIEAFPVLACIRYLRSYGWDTPLFRSLCGELGIDPDESRPVFRAGFEDLAAELLQWVEERRFSPPERHTDLVEQVVFRLLELLRADRRPDPQTLDWVRYDWPYAKARLPRYQELERLVRSGELLEIDEAQHRTNDPLTRSPLVVIDFLPSREGTGFSASIYGFYGDCAADGWVTHTYSDLHGLAVELDQDEYRRQSWLPTVVRRLKAQGVIFLSQSEARHYLNGEGAYWAARWGHNGS